MFQGQGGQLKAYCHVVHTTSAPPPVSFFLYEGQREHYEVLLKRVFKLNGHRFRAMNWTQYSA